jgi:hypothetical protein
MKVAKRPVGSWTYIPKEDRELPADKQTRVVCRQLSQAERMTSWDNLNWTQRDAEGNVTLLPRTFQLARELCINCIISVLKTLPRQRHGQPWAVMRKRARGSTTYPIWKCWRLARQSVNVLFWKMK